jgi:hypothetical protein
MKYNELPKEPSLFPPRCPRCGQEWANVRHSIWKAKKSHGCILKQSVYYSWSQKKEEEFLYLDVNWFDHRTVVWNLTAKECWIGMMGDVRARTKHAIKLDTILPYTINKAQLGKYLILL